MVGLMIVLAVVPGFCFAQDNWELKKSEDGIAVYARKLNNEKFKEIRVLCEFKSTTVRLMKVLKNVNHHKDWVYNTRVSYLIARKAHDTTIYYSEISLPWPVSNRDIIVQLSFEQDSVRKTLKIHARGMPGILPKKPNLVRVPYSLGLWNVTTLPNQSIKIDYTFSVNPGGALPAWLVNFTATAGPYNTFKKLKALLENGAY